MRSRLLISTLFSLLALSAFAQETPAKNRSSADAVPEDAELEAFVDGVMATYRQMHAAPGYAVSVVRPDRVVFSKGYGHADIEEGLAVSPSETRFYVASISKTFVWTAVMLLVDRGVLDLDRDVNDYLTRLSLPGGERALTLNDLMTHRAGFEESLDVFTPDAAALPIVAAMTSTQPSQPFPRGERSAYSNWGSNLVALIIEDVTGQTFESFLYAELLQPLGMSATVLTEKSPNANETSISRNYRVENTGPVEVPQRDLGAFAPIAGITTTADDMARWMRFHLNRGELDGARLMSEDTYALMRSRHFDEVPGGPSRAHGFADVPYRDTLFYGHTGSINAFYSSFVVSPELGLGVFISQNASDSFDPLAGLPKRVFDRAVRARGAADFDLRDKPTDADKALAESIAGGYISNRRVVMGLLKVLALLDGTLNIAAKDGYIILPNQPAYQRIEDNLWENRDGSRIAVLRDDDGNVLRLLGGFGATHLEPVTFWTNPTIVGVVFGITALFSVTTWLGLWRRFGHIRETTSSGRLLSLLALVAVVPFIWIMVLGAQMEEVKNMSFVEIFDQWPPPLMLWMATAATLATLFGLLLALGLPVAWRSTRWNIWRKLHYSFFAVSYALLGVLLVNWGAAPYVPGISF